MIPENIFFCQIKSNEAEEDEQGPVQGLWTQVPVRAREHAIALPSVQGVGCVSTHAQTEQKLADCEESIRQALRMLPEANGIVQAATWANGANRRLGNANRVALENLRAAQEALRVAQETLQQERETWQESRSNKGA